MPDILVDDETIQLYDAHGQMEELNINEVHDLMNNMHRDELINDNEDYEDNNIEYVDEVQNNQLVV